MMYVAIIAILAVGVWIVYEIRKSRVEPTQDNSREIIDRLNAQLHEFSRSIGERIENSSRRHDESFNRQHQSSTEIIRNISSDISSRMTEILETNKQVLDTTGQLKQLSDILKNPKQRGVLGEYFLETTLKNSLPPSLYQMQYRFDNNEIVDAVVFVNDLIVPIDSKFSLENYNRIIEATDETDRIRLEKLFKNDLKMRIDETSKYIQPSQGTTDFAFMFLPHEAIYYDLLISEIGALKLNTQDLIEYAFKKKVLIVSPTTFLAYLQTVLQGLKAMQIEQSAKEIQKKVGDLTKHLEAYSEYHGKLGAQLKTAINTYNTSSNEFKKVDKDLIKITGEGTQYEVITVDVPSLE